MEGDSRDLAIFEKSEIRNQANFIESDSKYLNKGQFANETQMTAISYGLQRWRQYAGLC